MDLLNKLKAPHLQQGEDAESACADFLIQSGLKLIDKNYRCRFGEIDIIMQDGDTLVFVEVRFRKNNLFGGGLESITAGKQSKLRKTAERYLQMNSEHKIARFDVVSMSKNTQTAGKDKPYHFDWISNAF